MSNWRRRKRKFSIPINSIKGIMVITAIMLITSILFLQKERVYPSAPALPVSKITKVRVIDGDTIEMNDEKIRIHGIDAPEKGQPCEKNSESYNCGEASKEYLKLLITGMAVSCDNRGKDSWGRKIAVCKAGTKDIGKIMVRHGWAIAYQKYSSDYVKDEYFAKSNELGMWSKDFSPPSEWRKLRSN